MSSVGLQIFGSKRRAGALSSRYSSASSGMRSTCAIGFRSAHHVITPIKHSHWHDHRASLQVHDQNQTTTPLSQDLIIAD